jgi:pimeloyl-[acyl-carrier protein] synthase
VTSTLPRPTVLPVDSPVRPPLHPVQVALAELGIEPSDRGVQVPFWQNPYPYYELLRSHAPVLWSERLGRWLVSGYDEVSQGLRNPAWSSNRVPAAAAQRPPEQRRALSVLLSVVSRQLAFNDPPHHTRLRRLVGDAFSSRAVQTMRARVGQIADQLLDEVEGQERMDVIADFAHRLPAVVILEVLGLPAEDHERFKGWSTALTEFIANPSVSPESDLRAQANAAEALDYFSELIPVLEANPGDSLLSRLVGEVGRSERLTREELLANAAFLLIAGHETSTYLIGNSVLALADHPDQWDAIHRQPERGGEALEELLRYDGPIQLTGRAAMADIQVGRATIPSGAATMFLLGAANRDPKQFVHPDRLILGRSPNRHVAFGAGVHFCLGAALARMEVEVALAAFASRFPTYVVNQESVRWQYNAALRGPRSLLIGRG